MLLESGETIEQCVQREVAEEVGLQVKLNSVCSCCVTFNVVRSIMFAPCRGLRTLLPT